MWNSSPSPMESCTPDLRPSAHISAPSAPHESDTGVLGAYLGSRYSAMTPDDSLVMSGSTGTPRSSIRSELTSTHSAPN
jgi:hypothetical protein